MIEVTIRNHLEVAKSHSRLAALLGKGRAAKGIIKKEVEKKIAKLIQENLKSSGVDASVSVR